jgi:hypothetical protein
VIDCIQSGNNKSIILYGTGGEGKSYLLRELDDMLKEYNYSIFVQECFENSSIPDKRLPPENHIMTTCYDPYETVINPELYYIVNACTGELLV